MNRLIVSAMVLSASLVGTQAVFAAPAHLETPVHAAVVNVKAKLIKFSVRNDTKDTVKLKAGDNEVAIAPGKTADMKLPEGSQILTVEAANREPGSVLGTVNGALSGNTLVLR